MKRLDAVIEAPTGSGKTLAFLVPLVERLAGHRREGVRALIVAPTRELATQIGMVLGTIDPALRVALVYGGVGYGKQLSSLRNFPDVVIGCPGRILDLVGQRVLKFDRVEYLVLDEADEMLDQGFAPDVERILALAPKENRQMVLASATMPGWVQTMIAKHLVEPVRVRVIAEVTPALEHGLLAVPHGAKIDTLDKLLKAEKGQTIVFHRTKHGAKKLTKDLTKLGHFAGELHGNLSQNARDKVISQFRRGDSWVLVATNVAARGIDVANVGLIVNFELPDTPQWLTHRVGRTARNGADGRALTFLSEEDRSQWQKLRRLGAPDLPHVDSDRLLADGEWIYHRPAVRPVSRVEPRRTSNTRVTHTSNRSGGSGQRESFRGNSERPRREGGYQGSTADSAGNRRSDGAPSGRYSQGKSANRPYRDGAPKNGRRGPSTNDKQPRAFDR
jgi:superfamily II DNA/RNA helicase